MRASTIKSLRGGRLCLDSFPLLIGGSSAGCRCGLPFSGGTPGGRSPSRVAPRKRRRNSCCHSLRQMVEIGEIRRSSVKARMRALAIVEFQIAADRGACLADAVVGSEIDLFVFDR